jgi:hypothetical protein
VSNPIAELKRVVDFFGLCHTDAILTRVATANTQLSYESNNVTSVQHVRMRVGGGGKAKRLCAESARAWVFAVC